MFVPVFAQMLGTDPDNVKCQVDDGVKVYTRQLRAAYVRR